MAKEHIFPLFLDGDAKDATTGDIPVDTSYVTLTPDSDGEAFTLGDGTIPGQLLVLTNTSNDDSVVTITNNFSAEVKKLDITADKAHATLMWTGAKWVLLGSEVTALLES